MNSILHSLYQRKSVRAYGDRPIVPEDKQAILEAALQAPTAGNMTLYTILDITDPAIKEKLADSCDHQPFISTAPMVLIFCADYHRWYQLFRRFVPQSRTPSHGDLMLAQADALIAAQNCVVAAESLGIGSCYIGDITEQFEFHRELLHLPRHVVPTCMLCFGYPTPQQQGRNKPNRFRISDIVYQNSYPADPPVSMEDMLLHRQPELTPQTLPDWVRRFCQRKWNCAFSQEMSRSCREMICSWCKDS